MTVSNYYNIIPNHTVTSVNNEINKNLYGIQNILSSLCCSKENTKWLSITVNNSTLTESNDKADEDLTRMKLIHKNFQIDVEKDKEKLREEIKSIKNRKIEVEDRYDRILREREQMKTKEKTLLKLFDIIDLDQIIQGIDKDRENENVFECAVCEQIDKSK